MKDPIDLYRLLTALMHQNGNEWVHTVDEHGAIKSLVRPIRLSR